MKPVMKHIQINGHGYKKARHWNMVSSLTRRQRLALQAPSPDTATDHGAPSPDPIPQSPIGNHQLETSKLPNPQTPAQATLEPQPALLSDLGGSVANPTPPIGQSEID